MRARDGAEHQQTDRRFWRTQDDDGSTVLHVIDGCDDDGRDFDLDHVVRDAHGGRAAHRNMRRVCKPHHRLGHLRGWHLLVLPNGRVGFVDRDGRPVDHHIPTVVVRERAPTGTPVPAWGGEPLDVNLVAGRPRERPAA